ncbi:hypothetical protein, partial [Microcoleus sp. S13_C3]
SRPSFLDGRDAHPTNLWKLFNSHSLDAPWQIDKKCDRPQNFSKKIKRAIAFPKPITNDLIPTLLALSLAGHRLHQP